MISDLEKESIKKKFVSVVNDVEIAVFSQEFECQFCKETRDLMLELGALSDKIKITIYDFVKNGDEAIKYKIKKIPAIAITGKKDYGIRYYGVPGGYEFPAFVDDIIDVSKGTTTLPDNIRKKLADIKKPVHMQVFVSPTCPYCPKAARIAHQFAIENEFIRADIIEMTEFPYLVQRYRIMSTPHIVINEDTSFVGAQPPEMFVEQINMALQASYNPMYS
jgi:glutaredoxin-like protein